ncbi:amidase [Pusillimonas minor]|uniref:Amidase n=1 Tax=Pusillimonas minor TaxID=2697024 RepID=A0A842HNZ1_9BURK|nr:amidase [Pusillimonas minor]MBC2769000.1 amidase [Pusillimonas minor]
MNSSVSDARVQALRSYAVPTPADPVGMPNRALPAIAPGSFGGMSVAHAPLARLARGVASGEVNPVDRVQHFLQVIAAKAELNAFIYVDAEGALQKARQLQRQIADGYDPGPLAGVVFAVKDCIPVAGLPYQAGSLSITRQVARQSAPAVARLEAAGAIVIGMANMHELSYGGLSNNMHFGAVGHPLDPSCVPGGSSGGSAVAVAAGMADFALGTDAAGSVRMPAALCGLVGFKASYDVIPRDAVIPLTFTLDHVGPLTKTVADAALVSAVMAQETPEVLSAGAAQAAPVVDDADARPMSLDDITAYCPQNFFNDLLQPGVHAAYNAALNTLQNAGLQLQRGTIPALDQAPAIQHVTLAAEAAQVHDGLALRRPEHIAPDIRSRLEAGRAIAAVDYIKAQRLRTALTHDVSAVLIGPSSVMVTPTVLTVASPVDAVIQQDDRSIPVRTVLTRLTSPFNLTGMPAISIPCGVDAAGFPVGLHIGGKLGDDALVLATAAAFEAALAVK